MAAESSAYQHALGKSFNDLPPVLRRFVGAGKARYSGACKVTRGSTGWSRFVGLLMGLPRKTPQADFALDVDHAPHRCIWVRHFPKRKKLKTIIKSGGRAGGGVMVESVGAATLTFHVNVDDGRLLLVSQRGRFLGMPLPGFLAPRTEASIGCDGETVLVESTVTLGRRSRLMRYSFEVTEAAAETKDTPAKARSNAAAASEAPAEQTTAPAGQAAPAAPSASEAQAGEGATVSQRAPRPAEADARTVPISKADERGLRAELDERTEEAAATEAEANDSVAEADGTEIDDDATAVLGKPPVSETDHKGAEKPAKKAGESQLRARPLDADRATVPVSASKVRRIPRKEDR